MLSRPDQTDVSPDNSGESAGFINFKVIALFAAIGLPLTFFIFWAVTYYSILTPWIDHRELKDWHAMLGQVSDFYGGIVGTLLALAALHLVHKSYQGQVAALKTQKQAYDSQEKAYKSQIKALETQQEAYKSQERAYERQVDALETQRLAYESQERAYQSQERAYKSQELAYKHQQQEATLALIHQLYSDLLANIASIQYRQADPILGKHNGSTAYQGVEALYHYNTNDLQDRNSVLNDVNLIVCSFNQLVEKIDKTTFSDADAKKLMLDKAYLMAYSKIVWPVFKGIYHPYKDFLLLANWGNVDASFYHYENLVRNTVTHLRKAKLVRPAGQSSTHDIDAIVSAKQLTPEEWLLKVEQELKPKRDRLEEEEKRKKAEQGPEGQVRIEHTPNIHSLRDWLSPTARLILSWLPIPPEFKQAIIEEGGRIWKLNNSHLIKEESTSEKESTNPQEPTDKESAADV